MKTELASKKGILKTSIQSFFLLIFVTISMNIHGQTYILNEDFSAATDSITPPTGWENNTISGTAGDLWRFDNPGNRTMNFPIIGTFAIFDSEFYSGSGGAEQVDLVTPYLDCSINPHILLFFDHFFAGGRGGEGKVEIWDGSAWNLVDSFTDSTENPAKATYDISSWAGGNTATRLRFRWQGDSSMFWAIDNIKILAPLNYDAGIVEITDPNMPFDEGSQDIKISLRNYGYETITSTTIRWKVNGTEQTPFNWTGNLPYNSQIDDITIGNLNFPAGLLQNIQVWQENPNGQPDENPQNDSTNKSFCAAFCGDYTIGGADGDFESFTEAANLLNLAGVSCPVTFNVRDGVYNEQLYLHHIDGTSETNTITFQSESQDSSAVVISSTEYNYSNSFDYTLKIEEANYISFKHIGLNRNQGNHVNNFINANHILLSHCKLSGGSYSLKIQYCDSLTFENNNISGTISIKENNHYIKIYSNIINNWIRTSNSSCSSIEIINNEINAYISLTVNAYPKSTIIENNSFISSGYSTEGIEVKGNNIKSISGNTLSATHLSGGINCDAPGVEITNNYIKTTPNCNGIYLGGNADSCALYFNTVQSLGSSKTNNRAFAVGSGAEQLKVKNNIFSCTNAGIPVYLDASTESWQMDYNDYYSRSGSIGYYNDSTYKDFAAWQDTIHQESNGIHANPAFISDDSPEPTHSRLYEGGTNIAGITTDIDNNIRSNPPDIGALEFNLTTLDAGCDFFTSPANPMIGSDHPVKVTLINHGTDALTSVDIQWSVNEVLQEMYHWTGNLNTKERTEVTLSSLQNFSGAGIYDLKSWTENPNNSTDLQHQNDTAFLDDLTSPLCGTYTIGGDDADFPDFSSAALALNEAGVICPVVFNVRNGTYNESITLEDIPGSSEDNSITFQSESGDSSLVTLYGTASSAMVLNTVAHIQFKKIGIRTNHSGDNLIIINSNNIMFENCYIFSDASYKRSIILSNSNSIYLTNCYTRDIELRDNSFDLTFIGNKIQGFFKTYSNHSASHVIFKENFIYNYLSLNTNGYPKKTEIDDNTFYAGYSEDVIECRGNNTLSISRNQIFDAQHYTGIYCLSPGVDIINNTIETSGAEGAHGIGLTSSADSCRVLFNTIYHKGTNSTYSRGIWIDNNIEETEIKNNIFACTNKGIPVYFEGNLDQIDIDYNGYYSGDGSIGFYDDTLYTDMAQWQAKTQRAQNAVFAKPFFTSDSIPNPNTPFFNNAGLEIPGITKDLAGNIRSNPPDMGALEFTPPDNDAGLLSFTSPTNPLNNEIQAVKVVLMNFGQNDLHSAEIHWDVNGEIQETYYWNGALQTGEKDTLTIASAHAFNNALFFNVTAWTEKPNNLTDEIKSNDTAWINNLVAPICGTYTIGGADGDFNNFTEALTLLTESGITCPVTFIVRDGVYEEQLYIGNIPGLSAGNTITFESESGDSSAVTIINNQSNWNNALDYTIKISNASNIIFRQINIQRNNGSYNFLADNANNLTFENCRFSYNTYSAYFTHCSSVIFNNCNLNNTTIKSYNDDFTIQGCFIYSQLTSYNEHNHNIKITENTFYRNLNIYVQLNNAQPQSIIENNTFYAGGNYDVIRVRGNNTKRISGNRILNANNYTGIVCETPGVDIINNFVDIGGDANGIYLSGSADDCRVLFNTVNHRGTNPVNSRAIAIANDANNLLLKNNIFSCKNNGIPMYIDGDASTYDLDYNNYYSPNGNIGFYNGTTYTSLYNWGLDLGSDANSKNINPFFPEDTIPLPYQRQFNGAGLPISGIATDINGKLRNDQAPDIGAVEFMVDFGITRLINPSLSCAHEGVDSVTVLLRQFGDIPFTDIKIAYQVNGGSIIKDTIHGSINNDLEYTFREGIDISATGDYEFRIWLISTNDDNRYNDTLVETRYSKPSPEVSFSWSPECAGTEIQFNGSASVGGGHFIAGYEWIFDESDTSELQNPNYIFNTGGTYPVNFRAYSDAGCYADTTEMIQVWYKPQADYSVNNSCSNDTSYFTDNSLPMEGSITNWNWSFGDGENASVQDTKHKYGMAGDYESQLIVTNTNGCKDTLAQSVHVYEIPMADFSVDTVVVGQEAEFNDLSTSSEGNITAWFWDFDDGTYSAEQEPQHSYSAPGIYQVTLSVTTEFGCTHSYTGEAVVIDDIMAIFDADTVCFGTPTHFTDESVHNGSSITAWSWDFGDGGSSAQQNPEYIFASAGTHAVTLSITNNYGSVDDTTINIVVAANPVAAFSSDEACWESPTHFTDASSAGYGNISSWEWNFGSSQQNPEHTFGSFGTHNVRLVVTNTNGCKDTTYQDVVVKPSPLDIGLPPEYNQQILARYPFNGNADDVSGNNCNATVHGATLSSDRFGRENHAYLFDGISNYMVAPVNLNFHQEVSLTFWMQIESLPATKAAVFSNEAASGGRIINILNDGSLEMIGSNGNTAISAQQLQSGIWYHVCGIWTGEHMQLFIDNQMEINETATPGGLDDMPVLNIGRPGNGDDAYAHITLDNIQLYSRELQPEEIAWFNNGRIGADAPDGLCSGETAEIKIFNAEMDVSYQICDENHIPLTAAQNGPADTLYFSITDISSDTTFKIRAEMSNSCERILDTVLNITVYPSPVADYTHNSVCDQTAMQFTDESSISGGAITSWNWNFGDGHTSTAQNPEFTFTSSGDYEVELITYSNNACSDTITQSVHVFALPVADFLSDTACWGDSTAFTDFSMSNEGQIDHWSWNFGDPASGSNNSSSLQNPRHEYNTPGDYMAQLIVTDINGCSDTLEKNVPAGKLPQAWAGTDTTVCENAFLQLNGEVAEAGTWNWETTGDGIFTNSNSLTTTYQPGSNDIATGMFRIILNAAANAPCQGDASDTMDVQIIYLPYANAGNDTSICENASLMLNAMASDYQNVLWTTLGDGSFDDAGSLATTYTPGTNEIAVLSAKIVLTAYPLLPCGDVYRDTLNISMDPLPQAHAGDDADMCSNAVFPTVGWVEYSSGFEWTSNGDGSFDDPGSSMAIYTPGPNDITNGSVALSITAFGAAACPDTDTDEMTLSILPPPLSNAGADAVVCENAGITLNGSAENYSASLWSSAGDGSFDDPNLLNALYTPGSGDIAAGSVCLYLSADGLSTACYPHTDSMLLSIQYLPEVFAGDDHRICSSEDIHLEAQMWYAENAQWFSSGDGVFDDPNNLHNVYHPGDEDLQQGYVDLWLSVEGEAPCLASATDSMRVEFEPYLHANAGSDQSVCANESVELYGGPVNADSLIWTSSGDGSFSAANSLWTQYTPGFNDISAGGVELYLTVFDTDGYCPPNQDTTFISIFALPATGFQASEECLGNATQFTDISSGAEISAWYWDFGDGNSSAEQNPEHQYAAAGTYHVTLNTTTTDGCIGSTVNEINVLPLPEFSFSFNNVCSGQPTNFQSNITGVPQARLWKFGDGETSGESHPLHQYPAAGTYECWLIVTAQGGCTDSLMQLVTVKESPLAQFGYNASCLDQPVHFTDLSQSTSPITSRSWDFGDGSVSTEQNPEHIYQQSGTFTVTLGISNEDGCSDTYTQNIDIVPLPVAEFSFGHACAGQITSFTDLSSSAGSNISSWLWDFGDGATSSQQNPQHIFVDAGSYSVQLTVANEENCTHSKTIDLIVSDAPQLFLGNDTSLCPGDMLTLDAGTHASYLWQDGSTLPYFTVYGPGTYWVEVSNTAGCSTSDTLIIFNEPGIDISGIVSIEGEAVANALVKIHAFAPDHLSPAFDSAYTDADGFYMLKDVSPCFQYLISAQSEEHENSFRTWYEQAAYWNLATMVDTSLGMSGSGLENIDIELLTFYNGGTGDATLCGNVSYDIHGKHPLGEPIKNVDISLELLGTEKADSIPWHIIKRTKTDDLGDYCFTEVNGGDYRIVVDLPCLPMDSMYYLNIYNADTSIYDLDYIVDSTGIYIVTTGMEDIYGGEHYGTLQLFPNPSNGAFEIRFESNKKGRKLKQIQMLDINGKVILNETINTRVDDVFRRNYNLASDQKGVFILRFICDDFVLHKRFIVK